MDSLVPHPFTLQPLAHTSVVHEVNAALLEHTGTHPLDNMFLSAILNDDRIDTREVKEMTKHQAGRPGANDSDLCAGGRHEWWRGLKTRADNLPDSCRAGL